LRREEKITGHESGWAATLQKTERIERKPRKRKAAREKKKKGQKKSLLKKTRIGLEQRVTEGARRQRSTQETSGVGGGVLVRKNAGLHQEFWTPRKRFVDTAKWEKEDPSTRQAGTQL